MTTLDTTQSTQSELGSGAVVASDPTLLTSDGVASSLAAVSPAGAENIASPADKNNLMNLIHAAGDSLTREASSASSVTVETSEPNELKSADNGNGDGKVSNNESGMELGDVKIEEEEEGKPVEPAPPAAPAMDYPDDEHWGYGAVVVAANFFILFLAAGLQYAAGSYIRSYYVAEYFGPDTTYFSISWLGSLIGIGFPLFGPFAGPLTAYFGPRIVIIAGTTFQALGLLLASFSTQVWQMLLSQGLMFGIGEVFVYLGSVNAISQYYLKRRGLAIGIAVSGSGFGGLAMASITQILIDKLGFPWSLRVLCFLLLGVGLIGGLLIRQRITPNFRKPKTDGVKLLPKLDFSVFKNTYFLVLYISGGLGQFGYFVPFYFISAYSTSIGLSASLSSLSLGLMNGASAFGRIGMGYIGDRIGYLNAFVICQILTPIFILLIWPFASSFGVIALFSILYGFFAGGFISIMPAMINSLFGGGAGLVAILGMQMSSGLVASIAGPPIAGAITDSNTTINADGTKTVDWLETILYAGLVMLVGNVALIWIRGDKTKWKFITKI